MEETIEWERLENASRKLEIPRQHFMEKMGTIKERNGMDLTETEDDKKRWYNTQKNYAKNIFTTCIITIVRSVTKSQAFWNGSQVGLRKHHYEQSYWS